ncbi:four helix bundle protein [Pedobacter sp. LMG 31464]|uniref:Four helix bundle protein n=1 Tax=Pedobacter planticolens TaxID=2679964 RepID=A0A923IWC3_9SPHI|nr:four helix bundle protein [Pedobacter planticolens]MBB2146758.1 four helix bundle protein [Pedobacter planticolens]
MHKYKELKVWQRSIELVTEIYTVTAKFPDKERFGLISQINRASVSIPSNIAEGTGRNSTKEFLYFLSIAHASSYETETQLIISKNLNYLTITELDVLTEKLNEWQKMSYSFQAKLRTSLNTNI